MTVCDFLTLPAEVQDNVIAHCTQATRKKLRWVFSRHAHTRLADSVVGPRYTAHVAALS